MVTNTVSNNDNTPPLSEIIIEEEGSVKGETQKYFLGEGSIPMLLYAHEYLVLVIRVTGFHEYGSGVE